MCMMSRFVQGREADGKFQVIDLDDVWVSVMGARECPSLGLQWFCCRE